jgi:hypothetical protein
MKLSDIILKEYGEFNEQEKELQNKVESAVTGNYSISVNIGAYSGDRTDDDPLKGRGFGDVTFLHKNDLPEEDFNKAIDVLNSNGYEVDVKQSSRFYDSEPGERNYYPKIKFGFKIN